MFNEDKYLEGKICITCRVSVDFSSLVFLKDNF